MFSTCLEEADQYIGVILKLVTKDVELYIRHKISVVALCSWSMNAKQHFCMFILWLIPYVFKMNQHNKSNLY